MSGTLFSSQKMPPNVVAALFALFIARLVLCSEQSRIIKSHGFVELTEQSISRFTAHLAGGPADPLIVLLQDHLAASEAYQELCMKYLIGSVVVSGSVDKCGLSTIRRLCSKGTSSHLPDLLDRLEQENSLDAVALFMAEHFGRDACSTSFRQLARELIKENWSAMEGLAMRTLAVLKRNEGSAHGYCFVLRQLPAERQYGLINAGEVPLDTIGDVYDFERDFLLLREIFFLARCSCSPNPEIRKCIAGRFYFFRQYLAADGVMSSTKGQRIDGTPILGGDALHYISKFMDIETLAFVMPLVCKAWRSLYWVILLHDTRIHDLYLLDLNWADFSEIHTDAPWRYCLQNGASSMEYFGRCIRNGALYRAQQTYRLVWNVKEYLKAMMNERDPFPGIKDSAARYDAFLEIFERTYEFCPFEKPALDKPSFLTDNEYEQAVYYFVCRKGWVLRLSNSLVVNNMPRLFGVIDENEEVMKALVSVNFEMQYLRPSIILLLQSQAGEIQEKLIRLIFSQTDIFKKFVEPKLIQPGEYYNFVAESGVFAEIMMANCTSTMAGGHENTEFCKLVICLILFFKDDRYVIEKIVAAMKSRLPNSADWIWTVMQLNIRNQCCRLLENSTLHSPQDVEFVRSTLERCRS